MPGRAGSGISPHSQGSGSSKNEDIRVGATELAAKCVTRTYGQALHACAQKQRTFSPRERVAQRVSHPQRDGPEGTAVPVLGHSPGEGRPRGPGEGRPRGPPPREPHAAERWPRGALWRQLAERWAGSGRHPRPHEGTRHTHSFHLRNIFLARKGGWRQLQARELITDLVQQARSTHTHKCGVIQPARSRVRLSRSNTHRDTYS